MTNAQVQLMLLFIGVATRALKVGLLALNNVRKVQRMNDQEVAEETKKQEAISADLEAKLDAH